MAKTYLSQSIYAKWFAENTVEEGGMIIFEMPPFCSGNYTARIYKDDTGFFITQKDDYFKGCRDFTVFSKEKTDEVGHLYKN